MEFEDVISDLLSRDTHKVWIASNEIIKRSQDYGFIKPFIKKLRVIEKKTKNLDMGGAIAPNKRFVDKTIQIIKFYKKQLGCPCELYHTNETSFVYDGFDPRKENEKSNIRILTEIKGDWMFDYTVECLKCGQHYEVMERNGHNTWWKWKKIKTKHNNGEHS